MQSLEPADTPGAQGPAVEFTDSLSAGPALTLANETEISVLETGYYCIHWEVFKTGYDSAFALFYGATGSQTMIPGGNYGAMAHDEQYHGQAIALLTAGGVLTLNRIDTLFDQSILNVIGDGTIVTGASIIVIKIGS